jgi:hypothetical protein
MSADRREATGRDRFAARRSTIRHTPLLRDAGMAEKSKAFLEQGAEIYTEKAGAAE